MSDYYVIYEGTRYDYDTLLEARTQARSFGASAVLHVNGQMPSEYATFQGVITVLEANALFKQATSGFSNGVCNRTDVTVNGGTVSNYLFAAGYQSDVTKETVRELSKLTINSGAIGYVAAIQSGTCHDVEITVNGGNFNTVCATASTSGNTINGDFTLNFNGGTTANIMLASSVAAASITITGKVTVNMTGGYVSSYFMPHWARTGTDSTSAIQGGYYVNLTGGSIKSHVYGTGNGRGSVTGGVHILVDGLVSTGTWIYGASASTADAAASHMLSSIVRTCDRLAVTGLTSISTSVSGRADSSYVLTISSRRRMVSFQ